MDSKKRKLKEKFEDIISFIVCAILLAGTYIFCSVHDFMEKDGEFIYIVEKIVFISAAVIFLFLLR